MNFNIEYDLMEQKYMARVHEIDEENNLWDSWSVKKFSEEARKKNNWAEVVLVNDEVAGFLVWKMDEKKIFILKFEVAEKFQDSDLPKSILSRLLRRCTPNKRDVIEAMVPDKSEYLKTHNFYKKLGFIAVNVSNFYGYDEYNNKNDGYRFRKSYNC